MASTLSWLDSSEVERRSVMELVAALNEPSTLDELGIGTIRDTIADELFPGTSTIQTRARYFLFIPWIMQMVEAGPPRGAWDRSRALQLRLAHALIEAHDPGETGVIGRESGAALQRWPLEIYWLGLERWGIRRRRGPISAYFDSLRRPPAWHLAGIALEEPVEGRRDEAAEGAPGNWAAVPRPPDGFPDAASFDLTAEEARFLRERVALSNPGSYLAHVLQASTAAEAGAADYPWNLPAAGTAPPSVRRWLHDARLLGLVHRGGVLLYSLMLAEEMGDDEGADRHRDDLAGWLEEMAAAGGELGSWDRAAMWARLLGANPRLRASAREFCERWFERAAAGGDIAASPPARTLIRERELALKGARARLTHAEARDRRRGYPVSARLGFRWPQVRRISSDILAALERG